MKNIGDWLAESAVVIILNIWLQNARIDQSETSILERPVCVQSLFPQAISPQITSLQISIVLCIFFQNCFSL